jgi:IclR family transcriptional regulator, mhp operon transcriptional activator
MARLKNRSSEPSREARGSTRAPAKPSRKPVYGAVAASLKVLRVLEAVNDIGPAGLTALHRRTGLPKATTLRMLETLCLAGFATYNTDERTFAVGLHALALSRGYNAVDEIVSIAKPIVADLRLELGWPSDIVVCENDRLVIADTNAAQAQFSIVRSRGAGSQLPFTISATGRAWLAFCPGDVRERVLRFESPHSEESRELLGNPARMKSIIAETRRRGYGLQSGEFFDKEAGAGVPVLVDGILRCCINIITARNAVPVDQIERYYVPKMQKAAEAIAAATARQSAAARGARVGSV